MEYYYSFSLFEQEEREADVIGFEEGKIWLPANVFVDQEPPCQTQQSLQRCYDHKQYNHYQRRPKTSLPAHSIPRYHQQHSFSKANPTTLYHRPRYPISSRVSVGPGMQAVFLDSGRRTCGTGFFLPQKAGTNNTLQPSKKPAYSPVFLPSRVVQALNLNVHELGSQLSPRHDTNINNLRGSRKQDSSLLQNRNGRRDDDDDDTDLECVSSAPCSLLASQARSSSPEIFLPKEWSY